MVLVSVTVSLWCLVRCASFSLCTSVGVITRAVYMHAFLGGVSALVQYSCVLLAGPSLRWQIRRAVDHAAEDEGKNDRPIVPNPSCD